MFKINPTTKRKIWRITAMYIAMNMLAEYFIPMRAFALTGGPSQPEVESFEPVSTTDMVNLFSGDFNYNIPLLTVPGPNGGYPINLAYHAGIGMEQEASWVGLGWNINPGVINRNMRGLPDDFDGDQIKKTMYYKPQETWTMDWSTLDVASSAIIDVVDGGGSNITETAGLPSSATFSAQIHWNNYQGIGYGIGMNLTSATSDAFSSHYSSTLHLSYDTDGGFGVCPTLSYNKVKRKSDEEYVFNTSTSTMGLGYNSKQGLSSLTFSSTKSVSVFKNFTLNSQVSNPMSWNADRASSPPRGPAVTFSSSSAIPQSNLLSSGSNVRYGVAIGDVDATSIFLAKHQNRRFGISYSETESDVIDLGYNGYGYMYEQDAPRSGNYLLDFNREKDAPANKNAMNIQPGFATGDILFASGQGVAGAFKPFRSEVVPFYDAPVVNQFPGVSEGIEFAHNTTSNSTEAGVDLGVNYSRSYSGDWNDLGTNLEQIQHIIFENYSSGDPLYEPMYYKSTGEMTSSPLDEMDNIGDDYSVRFNLRNIFDGDNGIIPKVMDELVSVYNGTPLDPDANNKRTYRQSRAQLLSTRTNGQISNTSGYGHPVVSIYTANEFPSASGTNADFDYSACPEKQLGELTVTNPDGNRYVYGLPVYNNEQKDVVFTKDGFNFWDFSKTQTYSAGQDNQVGNSEGRDHFYMMDSIPRYAYSYLITAIYSPDYVDLTGNGPSDDDFGYWVKFNYSLHKENYGWRVPYRDANYSKNHISDVNDDKLSYMYGTKEVYYLNSVETKTHEANFYLNNESTEVRHDANGVPQEDFLGSSSMGTSNQLRYLKKIELISKKDPSKIIKTVNFDYDYSLCGGTSTALLPNNDGSSATENSNKGKLTLKKVWFSYLGNTKGELSPYQFQYTHDTPTTNDNPDYNLNHMDRWGNYMPDRTVSGIQIFGNENPYVNQSAYSNDVDDYMGAWNLKKISLPSGGEINVEYESDDYAYVQDKRAMQLQTIVGTGKVDNIVTGTSEASADGNLLKDDEVLIFFDLEKTLNFTTDAAVRDEIFKYVDGIDELYFKTFLKLKHKPGSTGDSEDDFAYDYVEGYAHPDKTGTWYGYSTPVSGTVTMGWIKVKTEERNPWNPIGVTDHPFKLAGWQYMRLERSDLFDDGNLFQHGNDISTAIQGFVNIADNFQRLFGYYNFCKSRGFCNELYLEDASGNSHPKPSYIRLNSPDYKKYGGGHRVKSIKISDGWTGMSGDSDPFSYEYGTQYSYVMPDGSSSGVAEYEPLIGGEENPFRVPLRYQTRMYPYRNDGLFSEEPFGESLFPAANVGYRRVVSQSISHDDTSGDGSGNTTDDVTKNRSGITVTEFYTAKDFPVISTYTDLIKKNFGIPVIVPFIGEIAYNNKGYSQGFSLELNNMHGQLKSQAVYSAFANINSSTEQPVSKVEYIYQTDPTNSSHLSSKVQVLDADGVYRDADLGKTHEFFIDRQQHSNFSVSAGVQINAGAEPPYIFWGDGLPTFEISRSLYRSISTFKVIERNGVLAEVRNYKDGAYAVTKNLMYDAETGQPLLTQTINDFDKPIYKYDFASHWAYNTMGSAYQNAGAKFIGVSASSGVINYLDAEKYFVPGDEIEYENTSSGARQIYWVKTVNASTDDVTLEDEGGNTSSISCTGDWTIIRSGRRNQQSSTNGVIVSLSNPVTDRKFPLFEAFNSYSGSIESDFIQSFPDFYTDCGSGETRDITIQFSGGTLLFQYEECSLSVHFPSESGVTTLGEAFGYDLSFSNGEVVATNGTDTYVCTLSYDGTCFQSCLDDVLHAEAYRFADTWSFDYEDAGDPIYGSGSDHLSAGVPNFFRYGTQDVWRLQNSWLYQVDRKQSTSSASGTNIGIDGTYKNFVLFDWRTISDPQTLNPQWTKTNQVTRYSPFGYELENRDTLGVYSSALYGYDNSLSTAVASNTKYFELGFDGFEDYTSPSAYTTTAPHGHVHFTSVNSGVPITLSTTMAHTGDYSLQVASNGPAEMNVYTDHSDAGYSLFIPTAGAKYHLSVWVKTSSAAGTGAVTITDVTSSTTIVASTSPDPSHPAIDGWRQINVEFVAPATTHQVQIKLSCISATSATAYFDDIRVQPYTSGIKTYVYDPNTLWLKAELDDRNYATFYNYDEQGGLVQVKKETENGIATIRTSRSNIQH
jgi:hypothetical protein